MPKSLDFTRFFGSFLCQKMPRRAEIGACFLFVFLPYKGKEKSLFLFWLSRMPKKIIFKKCKIMLDIIY